MKKILVAIALLIAWNISYAHHEHHKSATPQRKSATPKATAPKQEKDTVDHSQHKQAMQPAESDSGHHHHNMEMSGMSHAFSINLPMNRNGSGTSWLPDASPMFGYMLHSKKWMYMFHGNAFLRYNNQDFTNRGTRGDSKFDVPNWVMAMGQRKVGGSGLFRFSVMMSADALIAGGEGYPLLFQTGETWQGKPLIDRQHPHDLFSELSVSYAHALSDKSDVFVYLGYPGEPALGAVAFMHRPSALYNPDAPLSHHWVDATHITFGVATLGWRYGKFKVEASSFTGREPDENRYDFDKPRFDSWSGRISYNPNRHWALQASHGFLKSPEQTHPGENVYRTTASAIHSRQWRQVQFNATALWGLNKTHGHDGEHAALAEASLAINRFTPYMRYEWTQKSAEELGLQEPAFGHHDVFAVNALTLGAAYDILQLRQLRLSGGGQFSAFHTSDKLDALYGNMPLSAEVYIRLYPPQMR